MSINHNGNTRTYEYNQSNESFKNSLPKHDKVGNVFDLEIHKYNLFIYL